MRGPIWLGVLGLAAAGIAVWFFTTHERVEESVYVGFQGEARYNRVLAAARLLERLGFEAESRAGLWPTEWLPGGDDTIVLPLERASYGEEQSQALLAWIDQGGHLLVEPIGPGVKQMDELLAMFGMVLDPQSCPESDESPDETEFAAAGDPRPNATMYTATRLTDPEDMAMRVFTDECGNVVQSYQYGAGVLTVVADSAFLTNAAIGEEANARFFVDLVTAPGAPGKVWLIYGLDYPGLLTLLRQYAWPALTASVLLLAVFLWYIVPRFGPIMAPRAPVRRSLLEHIRASGRFLWNKGAGSELLKTLRAALVDEFSRLYPAYRHWIPPIQLARLAEHTGLTQEEIRFALHAAIESSPARFTRQVRILQNMRNSL